MVTSLNEFRAMNAADEYASLSVWAMALEDNMLADGAINQYSHRAQDVTKFCKDYGAIIQDGTETRYVLKNGIDVRSGDGQLNLPAGYDLKTALAQYIEKCAPHWGPGKPATDLAAQAFGLDGITPTLEAQGRFFKEECGSSAEIFNAEAKKYGHPGLGKLASGTRPASDTSKKLPPAADALRKNPWLTEPKNLNDPNDPVMQRRVSIITGLGAKKATELAKAAGRTLAGYPLNR